MSDPAAHSGSLNSEQGPSSPDPVNPYTFPVPLTGDLVSSQEQPGLQAHHYFHDVNNKHVPAMPRPHIYPPTMPTYVFGSPLPPAPSLPVCYLGVHIVDPSTPPAPLGSMKVPGYDPTHDFEALKALKDQLLGNGVDESAVLPPILQLTLQQRDALNDYCMAKSGRDVSGMLEHHILSNEVKAILRALSIGPLMYDVELLNKVLSGGLATDTMLLTELFLNRPQDELDLLIRTYKQRYGRDLSQDIENQKLSAKLERLFLTALKNQRTPDTEPVDQAQVAADLQRLVTAGNTKNEFSFVEVLVNRSRPHAVALIHAFGEGVPGYKHKGLRKVVKKTFSGDFRSSLLYVLDGVKPNRDGQGIWRDAKLLEKTMAGLGTRRSALVYRTLRAHWNLARFEAVKRAYKERFGRGLEEKVRGETSGPFRDALVVVVKSSEWRE